MSTKFIIQSSDPALLEQATWVAKDFAQQYKRDDVVGIVFLGGVARGYFDRSADIDIALFKKQGSEITLPNKFLHNAVRCYGTRQACRQEVGFARGANGTWADVHWQTRLA